MTLDPRPSTLDATRLAVSHIAWSPDEDGAAWELLALRGVSQIEVAPGRFFSGSVREALTPLVDLGFTIVGFQAILFGKPDLQLFEADRRPALLDEMKRLASLCADAGGRYLVFGAPKNRLVPASMTAGEAFAIAVEFFQSLGRHASDCGVTFGIEANPRDYGANFCTNVTETTGLVRAVNSPGIRWHLDTGELAMNHEDLEVAISGNADLIGSAHISEPNLGAFDTAWLGHAQTAALLASVGYAGPLSLEMKRPPNGLAGVAEAVDFVIATYGGVGGKVGR